MENAKPSVTDRLIAVLDGLTIDEATRELNSAINALQITQIVHATPNAKDEVCPQSERPSLQ
jgi:hypothetical protein